MLDLLDSLVRKSLVTVERVDRHTRYGMLETIRQFAEEQLAATGTISDEVRDRHARYFAEQAVAHWDLWEGPGYAPRSIGSTPSSPTCAPGSAGPPTTATS